MKSNKRSTKKNTIGILGGMGPASTAHFYNTLVRMAQERYGAKDDSDFPAKIIYSLPMTDWGTTGFQDIESVKRQLIHGIKTLEQAGTDFIVIPCNTVHHLYDTMQESVGIPIIHMIEETVRRIKEQGFRKAGVMGTESTIRLGVYDNAGNKHGINMLSINESEQNRVTEVIRNAEAGSLTASDTDQLQNIISRLVDRGAECAILGCTELPLALSQSDVPVPIFDTSLILAEVALAYAYGALSLSDHSHKKPQ